MERAPMILSAFFFNPQGEHRMSWRHPDAPGREIFDLCYYRNLAEAAEAACNVIWPRPINSPVDAPATNSDRLWGQSPRR